MNKHIMRHRVDSLKIAVQIEVWLAGNTQLNELN